MREVDPRVRFVPARLIRRIVKGQNQLGVLGFRYAHRRSLIIEPSIALQYVEAADLGLDEEDSWPGMLFLFENPSAEVLERDQGLSVGWRRLFHARVHLQIQERIASGELDSSTVQARMDQIGKLAFDEVASVLNQDHWLTNPDQPLVVYEEFAAVYLEKRHFSPDVLPAFFPSLTDLPRIDSILREDIDGDAIFRSTRPRGAPDPQPALAFVEPGLTEDSAEPSVPRSEARFRALILTADRARRLGNVVSSSILRTKAARLAGPSRSGQARSGAEQDLDALSSRLEHALGLSERTSKGWRSAFSSLLIWAHRGVWSVEAKLLYDLQKVCVDHEREIYELDLFGWIFSFGRRPFKRSLPNQRLVRTSKHLRSANSRLPQIRIPERDRRELEAMIHDATERAGHSLRARFRPLIERSFQRAEFHPQNLPERVSLKKLTEECLDRVVESSFLSMGDVRDAVARSALRQPDVSGVRDWFRGDRILLADKRFRVSLDGVYRRGEIYLRMLQRACVLGFGTSIGRWLTRYVVLPYGIAFGALVTVQELLGLIRLHIEMVHLSTVAGLGTLTLFLLYWPSFRNRFLSLLNGIWNVVRGILIDAPRWILASAPVRKLLGSPVFQFARRLLIQPLLGGFFAYGVVIGFDGDSRAAAVIASVITVMLSLLLITPAGRNLEEFLADGAAQVWSRFRVDFLPSLVRFFLDIFHRVLEAVERVLYTVDEALRFRSGQSRWMLGFKLILGAFWGILTYLIRIYVNLLIEPQVNPVKHFPTVTVAAKMVIPYLETLTKQIASFLRILGKVPSFAIAGVTVFFLPGLAGFVVWESKENWRLFEANRSKSLRPVMIGHHGETMRRLVLPGFHSGTIPKLHVRHRRAAGKACKSGDWRPVRKAEDALHSVEETIHHFADREWVQVLDDSGRFPGIAFHAESIRSTTNSVIIKTIAHGESEFILILTFSNESGILRGDAEMSGMADDLSRFQGESLGAAALGLFALAGVDAVGDFPRAMLPPAESKIIFDNNDSMHQTSITSTHFGPILWEDWVAFWESDVSHSASPIDSQPISVPNA